MSNPRLKVLIIDDEEDLCLLIKTYLSRKDCEVFTANSLSEGLKKLNDLLPDILFLDNNLPDGLGWEAAEKILKQHPQIQVHLISAFNPPLVKESIPVARVWEKPISLRDLDRYFH
jgi:two-component system, OmpR family, response regulator